MRCHNNPGIDQLNREILTRVAHTANYAHDWEFNPEIGEVVCKACGKWKRGTLGGCMAKAYGHTMENAKYFVLNENTLCYVIKGGYPFLGVLAGSVIKGGHSPLNGSICVGSLDKLRPATLADFEAFRVSPRGHLIPLA